MTTQTGPSLAEAVKTLRVFSDLDEDQTRWLTEKLEEQRYEAGELILRAGDPADHMVLVLEGEFEARRPGPDGGVFIARAGDITGLLPGSRLTHYPSTAYATKPLRLARLHKDLFWQMIERMPHVAPRLISVLTDRVRNTTRQEEQREKLAALGKLSAGLAHELNNPASAVRQAAGCVRDAVRALQSASMRLSRLPLSVEQKDRFFAMEREAVEGLGAQKLDPLEQSDREQELTGWLEAHQVENAWKLAPALVEAGFLEKTLDEMAQAVPGCAFADVLVHVSAMLGLEQLAHEIDAAAGRISELVQAIKEYSFMDQAPEQEIDIHQGIDSTLTILGHKLKRGVNVVREYDTTLPRICARGSELNQVWTNIIDNAIAAMKGHGEIHIRTKRDIEWLLVEIEDNGPGIPAEIQSHIFEPFFTTKDVGEGTGLGLEIVQRILRDHHGNVRFESRPGRTCFQIRLPIPARLSTSQLKPGDGANSAVVNSET